MEITTLILLSYVGIIISSVEVVLSHDQLNFGSKVLDTGVGIGYTDPNKNEGG